MDLKGVGLGKASSVYNYIQQASGISQNYYPERLGKLYLINAPWGFSSVFSVVEIVPGRSSTGSLASSRSVLANPTRSKPQSRAHARMLSLVSAG